MRPETQSYPDKIPAAVRNMLGERKRWHDMLEVLEKLEANNPNVKFILVVGDAINQLDASGEEVLRHLVERMKETGVTVVFSGLKRQIILVLKHTGSWDVIGDENIFATEEMALKNIYQRLSDGSEDDETRPLHPLPTPL